MPTWKDISDYARSEYKLTHDEDGCFAMLFGFKGGRTQLIRVTRFRAFDEEWLEFRSVVCKGHEMPPKVALRKNAKLSIGALALDDDDDYNLIHNAPLRTMDLSEFDRPLHVIAKAADDLEKDYSEGRDDW